MTRSGRVLRGSSLLVQSGAATDVGRVRDHNEDSLLAGARVFAVADGMGGHAGGEVASRLAVEALQRLEDAPATRPEDVTAALHAANRSIQDAVRADPALRGMGTTATGVTLVETGGSEHWVVFNVGDSRVYRLAGNRMQQITRDHSEVRELVDAGLLDPADAASHPLRNVITRSLGTDPAPDPDVWVLAPTPGERFVVCSDGLSGELDDRDVMLLARRHADPQEAADELVAAAVRAGGRDNVSVVVVAVSGDGEVDEDTEPRSGLRP